MIEKLKLAGRAAFIGLLGLLLFTPRSLWAGDEKSALKALKEAVLAADPNRAEAAFKKDHPGPPSKKEVDDMIAALVGAAISVMDQTAEFQNQFPLSKELAGNRASLIETLSTVFASTGLPVPQNRAADLELCARNLILGAPDDVRLYMVLCRVAAASPIARQQAIYAELSRESTPGPARTMALTALREIGRLGLPIDLAFSALDGRQVNLANLKGKVVLLDFWATTCVPCVRELPGLKRLYAKYNSQGLEIIGISLDSDKKALNRFVEREKISWPQFFDPAGETNRLAQSFGISAIPVAWLVDRQGLLRDLNAREDQERKVEALLKEQPARTTP